MEEPESPGKHLSNLLKNEIQREKNQRTHQKNVLYCRHTLLLLNAHLEEIMAAGEREARLQELGYPIDQFSPEGTMFDALAIVGDTVYASGQVPFEGDQLRYVGKVPSVISEEDAVKAAALCTANILRSVRKHLGSLDAIERVVRITGYVNSDPDFNRQHIVMHGASQLVKDVFGEQGRHARSALGLAQLPLGVSVEVEMILQLKSKA